ncbi:hypothetical protein P3342_004544 [Pyrenophora teres f. teres]|nr:hypothetical protein P3342_004544 [Pyrenophora teres f. teres]
MVVVDRLSKKKKFIAMENMEVPTVVDKFLEYIWREEGYPKTLVSDRGRQFTSHFWRRLCDRVGTSPKLSTAHHPETDGQTENANADLKQYLRSSRFAVGDWVLLNAKHIKTERPVKSLDHKNMGPYQITRVIDNMAYELDLPESLKNIFPAFHPWLLQPYEDDALPGQPRANDHAPPEVHLNDEGDTEYVIAQVLDSRIRNTMNDPHTGRRGCLQYKVEWVGDDQSKCWQPYFNLRGSKESVQDFHDRNPGRPGPHATFHDYDENGQLAIALLCVFDRSLNAQSGL